MNNTEFYDRLGVSKNASQDEIRKPIGNYLKISLDINKEPGAEEKYKEVQEAYETLEDEQNKAFYDQQESRGANEWASVAEQCGFGGFDGAGFGGFKTSSLALVVVQAVIRMHLVKGMTFQYRVNLKFEKAILARKEVKYHREASCHTCHGSGAKPGTSPVTCGRCHGSGVMCWIRKPLGMMPSSEPMMSVMVVVKKSKIHVRLVVEQVMKNKLIA